MGDRSALLEAQAALLASLVDGAPVPEGFDVEAVKELSGSLSHKRARTAALVWPRLAACLGARFSTFFAEHVAPTPLLHLHGPLADGWRLAEVCEAQRLLDDAATDELARVRLQFQRVSDGVTRRGGVLRYAVARGSTRTTRVLQLFGRTFWQRSRGGRSGRHATPSTAG